MITVIDLAPASLAPIPMYPGYSASQYGYVVGPRGKALKPTNHGQVSVSVGGAKRTVNVNCLIWNAFHGELPDDGLEYRDGNPHNYVLDNLVPARGRHKPSRYCNVKNVHEQHILLLADCLTWGTGNRICRLCNPGLPEALPTVQTYSRAYGTGNTPD
jgi:hypothetical protein